jgi:HK97 family phage major capsid protein
MDQELKGLIDKLGSDYTELRQTVAQKAEEAAKGAVDPLITAKIAAINAAIDEKDVARERVLADLKSRVEAMAFADRSQGGAKSETTDQREYRAGLKRYLTKGDEHGLRALEAKAMSVGSDPDGGYTVEADKSGRIISRMFETSPLRSYASVVSISGERLEGLRDTDEAASRDSSATPAASGKSPTPDCRAHPPALRCARSPGT